MGAWEHFAGRPGYGEFAEGWHSFGYSEAITSGGIVAPHGNLIWVPGTPYPWDWTPGALSVASDSADDTAGGTGGRQLLITGLALNGQEQEEALILNGTTPVFTALSFSRVNRATVLTVGSKKCNTGTITVTGGAEVVDVIAPCKGVSSSARFSIPADWYGGAALSRLYAGVARRQVASAVFQFRIRASSALSWHTYGQFSANSHGGNADHTQTVPGHLPAGADIEINVIDLDTAATGINGGFEMTRVLNQAYPSPVELPT